MKFRAAGQHVLEGSDFGQKPCQVHHMTIIHDAQGRASALRKPDQLHV